MPLELELEQTSFYSRDPGLVPIGGDDQESKNFKGDERRAEHRRLHSERRGEVRFDLNSGDRREADGRRNSDAAPKYW